MAIRRDQSDKMTSFEQIQGSSGGYACGRGGAAAVLSCISLHPVLGLLCLLPEDEAILRRCLGSIQVRTETVDVFLFVASLFRVTHVTMFVFPNGCRKQEETLSSAAAHGVPVWD